MLVAYISRPVTLGLEKSSIRTYIHRAGGHTASHGTGRRGIALGQEYLRLYTKDFVSWRDSDSSLSEGVSELITYYKDLTNA